jgi:hypothetical protein
MIAEMLHLSPKTIRGHLLRIGHLLKALFWISHTLIEDLKQVRVDMCSAMLTALQIQEHNQWHNVVTSNASWLYFEYLQDRVWISSTENSPDFPSRTVVTDKHMLIEF